MGAGTAARSAARRRIALLLHDTQGRERRPPVGTAARSAAKRRIAPLFHDTPGRERRPPVGTAARQRSEAADRSSLSRHAGQGTPTSGRQLRAAQQRRIAPLFHGWAGTPTSGHAARSAATADRSSLSRHAGQGTPTSGRHAARSAAKGVYHAAIRMTLNTEVPPEKGPPRTWGSFPPPAFGGLCRAPPGELPRGRRSLACAPLCLVAWAPRRAPPGTELSCPAGCAGGRDHERFSRWGPAPLRAAQRSGGSLLSFTTRRAGNADLMSQFSRWGPAPLRAAQRKARTTQPSG